MPLVEKAVMHVRRRVEVGIGLIAALWAPEQLATFPPDAFPAPGREPLPPGAAPAAILTGAMWIDFDRDGASSESLLACELVDFASQLVRLFAVASPGGTCSPGFDFPEPLKEQDAAGILRAHPGEDARRFVGSVFIHPPNMPPELLVAALSSDGLAREPLLSAYALQMPIAVLIEAKIGHKHGLDDLAMPPGRDHREVFHIEVDRHGDQVRITL
ncbi:MAG TPA: hypothetical protein VF844_17465, partial [Ktedonobacteraceae bacterium]